MQQALFAQVRKKIDSLHYTTSYTGGYVQFITDLRVAYQEGAELGVHFDDMEKVHRFHEAIPQEGVFRDYTRSVYSVMTMTQRPSGEQFTFDEYMDKILEMLRANGVIDKPSVQTNHTTAGNGKGDSSSGGGEGRQGRKKSGNPDGEPYATKETKMATSASTTSTRAHASSKTHVERKMK